MYVSHDQLTFQHAVFIAQTTLPRLRSHLVSSQEVYKYVSLDARWGSVSSASRTMSTSLADTTAKSPTTVALPPSEQVLAIRPPTYRCDFGFLPIPKRLRYDPEKPFYFGTFLNVFFGICTTLGEFNHCYTYSRTFMTQQFVPISTIVSPY